MADPQVLYVVTAVVVLGLVAWVVAVLTRREPETAQQVPAMRKDGAVMPGGGPVAISHAPSVPPKAPSQPPTSRVINPSMKITPVVPPPNLDESEDVDVSVDSEAEDEVTGPQALILVTAVGRTDPGLKRKHNEDAYTILEDHHLFVIADGMGRHAAGEVASQLAVDAIGEVFRSGKFDIVPPDPSLPRRANMLRAAVLDANTRILHQAMEVEEYHGMGTTVVAAYFSPGKQRVYIAHVGDSRCYRLRDGKLKQLTTDHTLGAAGIQGKSSNVLSRAVGVEDVVEVDVNMESPLPGDVYLLCSDGLSRMATDEEIQGTLTSSSDLEVSSKLLIDLANSRGGRDNITTILVRVDAAKL